MNRLLILLTLITILVFGCVQKTVKYRMLPALQQSDSAVVMYYHKPGDPGFFNMIKVKEINILADIVSDVNGAVISAKDTCSTQGKLYFYGKAGTVETVYFSRFDDCLTLSFIKTGEKYYTRMRNKAKGILDSLERKVVMLPGRQD